MKRTIAIGLVFVLLLAALAGCGRGLAPELPEAATEFALEDYINPADPEDGYAAISYNGRIYAFYGTAARSLRAEDLGSCLGFTVQEGVKQDDLRICLLAADPEENYLARVPVSGFMDQPDFFRAVDTAGQEIDTPDFIQSLDYPIWSSGSTPEIPTDEIPDTEAHSPEASSTEAPTTEASAPQLYDTLDDSYSLEDYAFRLSEITPRDIIAQGWVVTDAILMRSMGADNPYARLAPEELQKDPNAAPELSEEGMLDPDGMVQIYLVQAGHEESAVNPLRLGVVNTGEETAHYLDCPTFFFSINETKFYNQDDEGLAEFTGPAGIALGMDREQLVALLGEPVFENGSDEMKGLFYLTQRMEELVLLLGSDGKLKALFYQDLVLYDPADYVFHN